MADLPTLPASPEQIAQDVEWLLRSAAVLRGNFSPHKAAIYERIAETLAALQQDAARLDWLEDMRNRVTVTLPNEHGARRFLAYTEREGGSLNLSYAGHPRDAIDEARAARGASPPDHKAGT